MNTSEESLKFRQFHTSLGGPPPGPLAKVAAFVLGTIMMIAAFMFSLVALAVVAVGAVVAGTWFWWKTRAVRRQIREQMAAQRQHGAYTERRPADGYIIEGEAVRESEPAHAPDQRLTS